MGGGVKAVMALSLKKKIQIRLPLVDLYSLKYIYCINCVQKFRGAHLLCLINWSINYTDTCILHLWQYKYILLLYGCMNSKKHFLLIYDNTLYFSINLFGPVVQICEMWKLNKKIDYVGRNFFFPWPISKTLFPLYSALIL